MQFECRISVQYSLYLLYIVRGYLKNPHLWPLCLSLSCVPITPDHPVTHVPLIILCSLWAVSNLRWRRMFRVLRSQKGYKCQYRYHFQNMVWICDTRKKIRCAHCTILIVWIFYIAFLRNILLWLVITCSQLCTQIFQFICMLLSACFLLWNGTAKHRNICIETEQWVGIGGA